MGKFRETFNPHDALKRYDELRKSGAAMNVVETEAGIMAFVCMELDAELAEAEGMLRDLGLVRIDITTEPGDACLCASEREG